MMDNRVQMVGDQVQVVGQAILKAMNELRYLKSTVRNNTNKLEEILNGLKEKRERDAVIDHFIDHFMTEWKKRDENDDAIDQIMQVLKKSEEKNKPIDQIVEALKAQTDFLVLAIKVFLGITICRAIRMLWS